MTKQPRTMYDDIKPPPAQTVAGDVGAPPKTIAPDSELRHIATAPRDGRNVLLGDKNDVATEDMVLARWNVTRQMHNGKWTPFGRWVTATRRLPIGFDPVVWKPEVPWSPNYAA